MLQVLLYITVISFVNCPDLGQHSSPLRKCTLCLPLPPTTLLYLLTPAYNLRVSLSPLLQSNCTPSKLKSYCSGYGVIVDGICLDVHCFCPYLRLIFITFLCDSALPICGSNDFFQKKFFPLLMGNYLSFSFSNFK